MANTAVNLVGLDFDELKTSLKEYMRAQGRFQDVDFEGSNVNVLLDVLAYNTYLNTFYTNMVASEMFLDTAQRRDSVISHAKSLNYVPRSFRSARAYVDLTVNPITPVNTVVLSKGITLTSKVGSNTFTFSVPETQILTSTNNTFVAANLAIYEGSYISETFIVDYTTTNQKFLLASEVIDTDSISVTVSEDAGTTLREYTVGTSLFGLTSTSQVCFLQAAPYEKYEILFGDGLLGRKPQNGSMVTITYRTSSGELANGANRFSIDTSVDGHSNVSIRVLTTATGGSVSESTESVKFNAPRFFQTQERAVTVQDYKTLLFTKFPEITSVNVYGGEDAIPPRYGKVLIAIDVANADGVAEFQKNEYINYVRDRCSLSIDPIIVDPLFMSVDLTVKVRYDANATLLSQSDIQSLVASTIIDFNTLNLDDFAVTMRTSKLAAAIDATEPAILSNDLYIRPYITIVPTPGATFRSTIAFGNAIRQQADVGRFPKYVDEQSVSTSTFTYQGIGGVNIEDDGAGGLQIVRATPNSYTVIKTGVGTVNYNTGEVNISGLVVDSYDGNGVDVYIVPVEKDVVASRNVILRIKPADIHITLSPERL